MTTSTPVTGSQYRIEAGDYTAVVTELGAGLRELHHRGRPVIGGYQSDEVPYAGAGQLLVPWPNRIDGGRYLVAGATCQLDLSEPAAGNAIHGLTRWLPWALTRLLPFEVRLRLVLLGQPGYPFCLEIEVGFALTADEGLRVGVTARNIGARPAPYGTGCHPYLTAGTPAVDQCTLSLPAARWLPVDERGIPDAATQDVAGDTDFRDTRPIGGTRLDHALTGLARDGHGRAWSRLAGPDTEVALWVDETYRWLQVFTGDPLDAAHRRRAIAIEPMTCPPNAFVSGTDLITLAPGASTTSTWGISVRARA